MPRPTDYMTARQLIQYIANDYIELSYDKSRWQRDDFMKACASWIENNPETEE